MFAPIRDAVAPVSDVPFARRVAAVVCASTLGILGAAGYVLLHPPRARELPAVQIPTIRLSGIGLAVPTAAAPADRTLALTELVDYATDAFPAWAVDHADRRCPDRLVELNRYRPRLHAVDPWGTPYQFLCGAQFAVHGLRTRSAGPDQRFDTRDDLTSP